MRLRLQPTARGHSAASRRWCYGRVRTVVSRRVPLRDPFVGICLCQRPRQRHAEPARVRACVNVHAGPVCDPHAWGRAQPQALVEALSPARRGRTTLVCGEPGLHFSAGRGRPMPTVVCHREPRSAFDPAGDLLSVGAGDALDLRQSFELFGPQPVYASLRGTPLPPTIFRRRSLQTRRHRSISASCRLLATPQMTAGHLLFAVGTTGYILLAIWLEERDLIAMFGDQYRRYREQVSMLIPMPGRKAR